MDMDWTQIESGAYWSVFVAAFLGVAIWETYRPRGHLIVPAARRWKNHSVILLLSNIISVALLRGSPVVLAASLAGGGFGLLKSPELPLAARWIAALLLLDFVRYATHRAFHAVPFLWRVHQVHHSDPDFDVSTGLRFHPLEVLITHGSYLVAIVVLAPPAGAVLLSELLSTFQNLFEHANVSLPGPFQRWAGTVFFTPDTHRIHHSEEVSEQNRNFGQVFTCWDRLLHSYLGEPAAGKAAGKANGRANGRDGLVVGLRGYQNSRSLDIRFMLLQPFISPEQSPKQSPEQSEERSPASAAHQHFDPASR